mmetsp:Transcript_7073/g.20838  ORF Transcript_7073/g.20838 Transcript_7073/m.20838 type:complete len:223 (+) Transcript_7073:719-1387(+)
MDAKREGVPRAPREGVRQLDHEDVLQSVQVHQLHPTALYLRLSEDPGRAGEGRIPAQAVLSRQPVTLLDDASQERQAAETEPHQQHDCVQSIWNRPVRILFRRDDRRSRGNGRWNDGRRWWSVPSSIIIVAVATLGRRGSHASSSCLFLHFLWGVIFKHAHQQQLRLRQLIQPSCGDTSSECKRAIIFHAPADTHQHDGATESNRPVSPPCAPRHLFRFSAS